MYNIAHKLTEIEDIIQGASFKTSVHKRVHSFINFYLKTVIKFSLVYSYFNNYFAKSNFLRNRNRNNYNAHFVFVKMKDPNEI